MFGIATKEVFIYSTRMIGTPQRMWHHSPQVTVDEGFTISPNSTLAGKTEMWHVAIRLGLQTVACLEAR